MEQLMLTHLLSDFSPTYLERYMYVATYQRTRDE